MEQSCVTRRAVVAGGCGLVAATVLTACAGYGAGGPAPAAVPNEAAGTAGGSAGGAAGAGPAGAVADVADVPVGGGVVLAAQGLVVTQPVAGTFKAFSATCTHQGCTVNEVADGTINCPCHGSRFAVVDGAPTAGPADTPLPARAVAVRGTSVVLA
jgi:Rieske Fe-S protein